ncbi:MAG: glycosyltransferase [Ornithinimicrobium sp.]
MPRKVLLVAWGSRGDVAPLVSLGVGLQAAGDVVSVLASRDFACMVEDAGLSYRPFDISVKAAAQSRAGRSWLGGHRTLFGEARALERVLDGFAGPLIEGLWTQTGDADLVVSGVLTVDACASLTHARGQAHALALLAPVLPSRRGPSSPSSIFPGRETAANAIFGAAVLSSSYRLLRVPGDEIRGRLGHRRSTARWLRAQLALIPTIVGASPLIVPPAPDRPHVSLTGYWPPYAEPSSASPSELARIETELDAKRRDGRPVAYLGFGSMTASDPEGTADLLVSAAARAGVHPVIGQGWGDAAPYLRHREDLTLVGDVPHDWLFSRCDTVVHHGGAGTTGSAIRAGAAQVVIAHMGDQPYWARRVHILGVAAPPVRRSGLSAQRLGASIAAATTGPTAAQIRQRAAELALAVNTEDGVAAAVQALNPSALEGAPGGTEA